MTALLDGKPMPAKVEGAQWTAALPAGAKEVQLVARKGRKESRIDLDAATWSYP